MDFQTFLVYTFLMTFCVGAGYMLALCPINKVNQEGRVERNRLYQAIVFSIILVYVVIVGFRYNVGVDYKNYLGWYNIYFRTGKYPVNDMDSSFLFINYVVKELNIHSQLYTLMHQSPKIKAAPKFKLRCGYYFLNF